MNDNLIQEERMKKTYGVCVGDRNYGVGDVIEIISWEHDSESGVWAKDVDGNEVDVYTVFQSESEIKMIY